MKIEQIGKKLLHYTGKAIADYRMIEHGDRVMLCLSGGKDSFTLLTLLKFIPRPLVRVFLFKSLTTEEVTDA